MSVCFPYSHRLCGVCQILHGITGNWFNRLHKKMLRLHPWRLCVYSLQFVDEAFHVQEAFITSNSWHQKGAVWAKWIRPKSLNGDGCSRLWRAKCALTLFEVVLLPYYLLVFLQHWRVKPCLLCWAPQKCTPGIKRQFLTGSLQSRSRTGHRQCTEWTAEHKETRIPS